MHISTFNQIQTFTANFLKVKQLTCHKYIYLYTFATNYLLKLNNIGVVIFSCLPESTISWKPCWRDWRRKKPPKYFIWRQEVTQKKKTLMHVFLIAWECRAECDKCCNVYGHWSVFCALICVSVLDLIQAAKERQQNKHSNEPWDAENKPCSCILD